MIDHQRSCIDNGQVSEREKKLSIIKYLLYALYQIPHLILLVNHEIDDKQSI